MLSSSSDSESCSEAESSSEEVAMQLANLKERVRITPVNGLFSSLFLLFYDWFYSWKLSVISWADLPRCPQRNKRKAGWKGRKYPKKRILSQSTNHQNARLLLRKQSRQKALHCKCQCLYSMIILYFHSSSFANMLFYICMSSQGEESHHCRAFPIKSKGVPTMTYQQKNQLKSGADKPADKLRTPNFSRAKKKSLTSAGVANIDVCNNNVDGKSNPFWWPPGKKTLNKAKFLVNDTSKLISLSQLFNTDQGAMKSTGATQSGKLQPPGQPLISSKMQKIKKRKCPVQLSGMNLDWQWISGGTKLSLFT